MTQTIFLEDCYVKETGAEVVGAEGDKVELDRTIFCYRGGGQPADSGRVITQGGEEYSVADVKKENGRLVHYVDREGLKQGDAVKLVLDWERRHKLMRGHTAMHVLAAIMHKKAGALITGNQIGPESRIDFSLEAFDRERMAEFVDEANRLIKQHVEVKMYFLPREEAMKIPGVVKLAAALPPNVEKLRIVDITGIDVQADGGTHVKNTSEIGQLEITRLENKGKDRKRIYFRLV